MRVRKKDSKGRFSRVHQIWHEGTWNDGFVAGGRMRVYRPDCPTAFTAKGCRGYAYRAHAVWWLTTAQAVPDDLDLHHRDGNSLNDSFDNLELLSRSAHVKHHKKPRPICICFCCRKEFRPMWKRFNAGQSKYCSRACVYEGMKGRKRG